MKNCQISDVTVEAERCWSNPVNETEIVAICCALFGEGIRKTDIVTLTNGQVADGILTRRRKGET